MFLYEIGAAFNDLRDCRTETKLQMTETKFGLVWITRLSVVNVANRRVSESMSRFLMLVETTKGFEQKGVSDLFTVLDDNVILKVD